MGSHCCPWLVAVLLCGLLVMSLPGVGPQVTGPSCCAYAAPVGGPHAGGFPGAPPAGAAPAAPAPSPARTTNTIIIAAVVVAAIAIIAALAMRKKPA